MRPTPKTVLLAVVAFALLALNLLDPGQGPAGSSVAHIIPPVAPEDATRIELSTATSKVVLTKDPETARWAISAPLEHPADRSLVAEVLHPFRSEIPVDVRVDTGNLAEYGLDASGGIVVEIWSGQEEPEVSFTMGTDAPGGSSFIRLSGDDGVYRARMGGRPRFERRPAQWRNRVVLDFEEAQVQGISIKPPAGTEVHLARSPSTSVDPAGKPVPGEWMVEPDPGWSLDSEGLKALVTSLGRLRARQILGDDFDGGFSPAAVELTVVHNDGTESTMAVGTQESEGLVYVRVSGGAAVYAVPAKPLAPFLQFNAAPAEDRLLFEVERAQMVKLIYWEGRSSIEVGPDPESGVWRPLGESDADVDIADIDWAKGQLARLQSDGRADGVSLMASGVAPPNMVFEVQRADGSHEAFYVGRAVQIEGRTYYYIARQNTRQIHLMSAERVARLQRAFGTR